MDILEVSELVLKDAGHPLTSKEIMIAAQKKKSLALKTKTPWASIGAALYVDIKRKRQNSKFRIVGKGKFTLNSVEVNFRQKSFKAAAYRILKENSSPMKTQNIAQMAVKRNYIETKGATPEATMAAQLYTDVKNPNSLFVQLGKNKFGLREWDLETIKDEIEAEEKKQLQHEIRSSKARSIVGDPIAVDGLVYGPLNENGVIFLFSKLQNKLGIVIENIQAAFPDAKGRKKTQKGWEEVWIEFEYRSSNFAVHGHDPSQCDIIVCWEHDWNECPLDVIELKKIVKPSG